MGFAVKWERVLEYDFNSPANERGDYLVTPGFAGVMPGEEVVLRDVGGDLERRGRVRYLIAAVEPIGDFEDVPFFDRKEPTDA